MKSIYDQSFRYKKSYETDVAKTFARVRREQQKRERAQSAASDETGRKILTIAARKKESAG
jgi:hypothetical protein